MSSPSGLAPNLQAHQELVNDERWQLVLRVAASQEFYKSARLRDFLVFICKRTLQDHREEVREQDIGCAVFGRRSGYNPSEDNIVRVEARELRKRLERYFAGVGKGESLEIRIPKGSYVPFFELRDEKPREPALLSQPQTSVLPAKLVPSGSISSSPAIHGTDPRLTYFLLGLLLISMTFGFWQWTAKRKLQTTSAVPTGGAFASQNVFWSRLFDARHETYIVPADFDWCLVQRLIGREFSLDDYVSRRYVHSLNTRALTMIAGGHGTGMSELTVLTGILHDTAPFQIPTRVCFARDISIEDLKSNNFILLGGQCSNPWGELFSSTGNFRPEHEFASRLDCYVNNQPLPGESARYCNRDGPGGALQTYCLISFVPNPSRSGNGLIIAGTTGEGTQAGGEFLTSADLDSKLREFLKLGPQETNIPYFELLLKSSGVHNGPLRAEYVAHRILTIPTN